MNRTPSNGEAGWEAYTPISPNGNFEFSDLGAQITPTGCHRLTPPMKTNMPATKTNMPATKTNMPATKTNMPATAHRGAPRRTMAQDGAPRGARVRVERKKPMYI